MKFYLTVLACTISLSIGFSLINLPEFGPRLNKGEIVNEEIVEASGIVASINNPGILWTHNDSGNKNRIFAIGSDGSDKGEIYLAGAVNRDWEDIAIGAGPDSNLNYVYVADIGDNNKWHSVKKIYRFVEPTLTVGQTVFSDTIQNVSIISFTYPDGERDAETLLVDPQTSDLFVLSKSESKIRLYKLAYPQSTTEVFESELVAKLILPFDPEVNSPLHYIAGGDIMQDGSEIIVKSISNIFYWKRDQEETIEYVLSEKMPIILPYDITDELQGEAICWNNDDDKGYYTLGEEIFTNDFYDSAQLYYYPRTSPVNVDMKNIENQYYLYQNYPNPFNPVTTIKYTIPHNGEYSFTSVQLFVFNILGEEVIALLNKVEQPGNYEIKFDAKNLPSGIYYYSLKFNGTSETKKMLFLK